MIVVSEYSPRFAKLIGKRNPVATLATLILLSYTKLLSTCLLVFSYDTLEYPNHNYFTVWLPDGNVQYYEGRRIIFLIVAYVLDLCILFLGNGLFEYQDGRFYVGQRTLNLMPSSLHTMPHTTVSIASGLAVADPGVVPRVPGHHPRLQG